MTENNYTRTNTIYGIDFILLYEPDDERREVGPEVRRTFHFVLHTGQP